MGTHLNTPSVESVFLISGHLIVIALVNLMNIGINPDQTLY